jgi:hypothetical protein
MQEWSTKDEIMLLFQYCMMITSVHQVVGGGLSHHQTLGLLIKLFPT